MIKCYSPLLSCQSTCYFLLIFFFFFSFRARGGQEPGPKFLSKVLMLLSAEPFPSHRQCSRDPALPVLLSYISKLAPWLEEVEIHHGI